jgi:ribonucleoside-diphosphate reductase alpha chain
LEAAVSERTRLPDRHSCELINFESMGMGFTAGVGRYPDGRIGELFIDNHKAGSAIGTLARDLAIAFSFAVQHGADAHAIRRALCRDSAGRALGPLGEILDLILKHGD